LAEAMKHKIKIKLVATQSICFANMQAQSPGKQLEDCAFL
jgi:hypothetical protein